MTCPWQSGRYDSFDLMIEASAAEGASVVMAAVKSVFKGPIKTEESQTS